MSIGKVARRINVNLLLLFFGIRYYVSECQKEYIKIKLERFAGNCLLSDLIYSNSVALIKQRGKNQPMVFIYGAAVLQTRSSDSTTRREDCVAVLCTKVYLVMC